MGETRGPGSNGIRGVLIVPAVWLVLGALLALVHMWVLFDAELDAVSSVEIFLRLGFVFFFAYAASRFFQRKRNAPRVIVILLAALVVVAVSLLVADGVALGAGAAVDRVKPLVMNLAVAAVGIAYFLKSKQVKATFVQ